MKSEEAEQRQTGKPVQRIKITLDPVPSLAQPSEQAEAVRVTSWQ